MRAEVANGNNRDGKSSRMQRKTYFAPESITGCTKEKMEGEGKRRIKKKKERRQGNQVLEAVLRRVATMSQSKLDPMIWGGNNAETCSLTVTHGRRYRQFPTNLLAANPLSNRILNESHHYRFFSLFAWTKASEGKPNSSFLFSLIQLQMETFRWN